jgi:RimJ/RimL family protein N-acetyltransferase
MDFNLQPTHLYNDLAQLVPLQKEDFERLYAVAKDPLIWEQHPSKNRYQKEVFQNYFDGAIASGGAFLILEAGNGNVMGSTRFYGLDREESSILIGYTFFARNYWGSTYNPSVKKLMVKYAVQYVEQVHFHVGAGNIRSQKAIEKLGAIKIAEKDIAYHGERSNLNFVYAITKNNWRK